MTAYSGLIVEYTREKGFQGLVRSFKAALYNGLIDGSQIRATAEKKTGRKQPCSYEHMFDICPWI